MSENQLLYLCRGCYLSQFRSGRMGFKEIILQTFVAGVNPGNQLVYPFFVSDFMNQEICPFSVAD